MFRFLSVHARQLASASYACLLVSAASCGGTTEPTPRPVPASMQIVSGDPQLGVVGAELPQPLVVKVLDADGVAVAGQLVNFRVTAGGGSVFAGSAITSNSGIAQERWTLGTVVGAPQTVEARAVEVETGAALTFATFHATATAAAAAKLVIVAGDAQTAAAGSALPDSLLVKVTDQYDNPIPGATVTWLVPANGGTLSVTTTVTSATGLASTKWTVPSVAGSYSVRVTAGTLTPADFHATVTAAAAATVTIDSGLVASATVGSRLPIVVRALDAFGNPVIGAAAVFTTATGEVAPVELAQGAVTDSQGRLRVTWLVSTSRGTQSLRVRVAGATSAVATITVNADSPSWASKFGGDSVTAVPGSTLVDPVPTVWVIDRFGNTVPGVPVNFVVTGGGGSVASASVLTNGYGKASPAWTLGTTPGTNTLTATVAGFPTITFTAFGRNQSSILISLGFPLYASLVGDTVPVNVFPQSSSTTVTSVKVFWMSDSASLVKNRDNWSGTLTLHGAPRDTIILRITATGATGEMTDRFLPVIHDNPPVLSVASDSIDVANPTVNYSATCVDDDPAGCRSIVFSLSPSGSPVIAAGTSSISGSVSLAGYANQFVYGAWYVATDSRGQQRSVSRSLYVENSTHLALAAAAMGTVYDYDGARILFGRSATDSSMVIRESDGRETVLPVKQSEADLAVLTPHGAAWRTATSGSPGYTYTLNEWRDGALNTTPDVGTFAVRDGYLAYEQGAYPTLTLHRRNLVTGVDEVISDVQSYGSGGWKLGTHGDVAYVLKADSSRAWLYRGGLTTLASDTTKRARVMVEGTDAGNVVFGRRWTAPFVLPVEFEYYLWNGGQESVLASHGSYNSTAGSQYIVMNAGWIAFKYPTSNGSVAIRLRAPAGGLKDLSGHGTAEINGVTASGQTLISSYVEREIIWPTGTTTSVSSGRGRAVLFRNDTFYNLYTNSIWRIVP